MGRLLAIAAAVWLLLASAPAAAGPWTKSLKEVYVKLGQTFFLSDSYVNASGNVVSGTNYLGATTSVYFEVGLWKKLHLQAYLPYVIGINDPGDGSKFLRASGGDALLALQYGLPLPVDFPVAVKVEFKAPLYDVGGVEGGWSGSFPAPGDGQMDVTFWLSAGGSLSSIPLFFFAEVGYRHRTSLYVGRGNVEQGALVDYGDGIAYFVQVGYTFFERVTASVNSGAILSFQDDKRTKSYITLGPSLYVPIKWGLAAEASFDPMVYTRNSSPGLGFTVGLSFKH